MRQLSELIKESIVRGAKRGAQTSEKTFATAEALSEKTKLELVFIDNEYDNDDELCDAYLIKNINVHDNDMYGMQIYISQKTQMIKLYYDACALEVDGTWNDESDDSVEYLSLDDACKAFSLPKVKRALKNY